jgi:hypothetical protein
MEHIGGPVPLGIGRGNARIPQTIVCGPQLCRKPHFYSPPRHLVLTTAYCDDIEPGGAMDTLGRTRVPKTGEIAPTLDREDRYSGAVGPTSLQSAVGCLGPGLSGAFWFVYQILCRMLQMDFAESLFQAVG